MVLATLRRRGLLAATTAKEELFPRNTMNRLKTNVNSSSHKHIKITEPVSVYLGVDPTADGLHVGHLIGVMMLRRFQQVGYRPIALIGGATGLVGDPSFRSTERPLLSPEALADNVKGIERDMRKILCFDDDSAISARLVNNYEWFESMNVLQFLREVGYHFRVGKMISRESVKGRLDANSGGLSFTEFSYQLLQGYDFLHLFKTYNCRIQLGGSDQWGNILGGTELVRKVCGEDVHGITFPLLTTASGQKFGKSAGNAIWLDPEKTSCYEFYQFFLRTEDADVQQLLYKLTDLEEDRIDKIMGSHHRTPNERQGQKALAEAVTRTVHGKEGLNQALRATHVLFGGDLKDVTAKQLLAIGRDGDVPTVKYSRTKLREKTICHVAAETKVCKSVGEARRLVNNGGLYVNNIRVSTVTDTLGSSDQLIEGEVILFRTGRKNYTIMHVN